jgi:hypothetical protein
LLLQPAPFAALLVLVLLLVLLLLLPLLVSGAPGQVGVPSTASMQCHRLGSATSLKFYIIADLHHHWETSASLLLYYRAHLYVAQPSGESKLQYHSSCACPTPA